jgi:hypothetical protein
VLSGPLSEMLPDDDDNAITAVPVDAALFLSTSKDSLTPMPLVFFDFDGDTPTRVHYGARAMTRR